MKYLLLLTMLSFSSMAAFSDYNGLPDSGDELFTLTDANTVLDDSNFELNFQYGSFNSSHEFGLFHYDLSDDSKSEMLKVFDDADGVGADSNVVWNLGTMTAASKYGSIDLTQAAGLAFGAYFKVGGDTFYSVSDFNTGDVDHFGFYWETDPFENANLYIKAIDDGTNFFDFDKVIVAVSDVQPIIRGGGTTPEIPEPTTLAIFGLGLLGLALSKRKQ